MTEVAETNGSESPSPSKRGAPRRGRGRRSTTPRKPVVIREVADDEKSTEAPVPDEEGQKLWYSFHDPKTKKEYGSTEPDTDERKYIEKTIHF